MAPSSNKSKKRSAHNRKGTPGYYEWLRKIRAARERELRYRLDEARRMIYHPEGSFD